MTVCVAIMQLDVSAAFMQVKVFVANIVVAMYVTVSSSKVMLRSLADTHFS